MKGQKRRCSGVTSSSTRTRMAGVALDTVQYSKAQYSTVQYSTVVHVMCSPVAGTRTAVTAPLAWGRPWPRHMLELKLRRKCLDMNP